MRGWPLGELRPHHLPRARADAFGGREYLALAVAGGDRVHGGVAINEERREVQPLQFLDVLMDR